VRQEDERKPTHIVLPPPPRAEYETELRANSELQVVCTMDLDICVQRITKTRVRIWTRRAQNPVTNLKDRTRDDEG
jgi:hypothetical protein